MVLSIRMYAKVCEYAVCYAQIRNDRTDLREIPYTITLVSGTGHWLISNSKFTLKGWTTLDFQSCDSKIAFRFSTG